MKWSEVKWSEEKWSEVKSSYVKWGEVKWTKVKTFYLLKVTDLHPQDVLCHVTLIIDHNTDISPLLSTSLWVLSSSPIKSWDTKPTAWLPCPPVCCGERRSPKVQPSTRPGIEPGTCWLAVRDLTNCANLAHTVFVCLLFVCLFVYLLVVRLLICLFRLTNFNRYKPSTAI